MTDRRIVLVLGPHAGEAPLVTADDLVGASTLVVLVIGWPLRPTQERAVQVAQSLARAAGIVLDAMLVASADHVAEQITGGDHLVVDGSPRDRRRIRRALATRGISAPDAR